MAAADLLVVGEDPTSRSNPKNIKASAQKPRLFYKVNVVHCLFVKWLSFFDTVAMIIIQSNVYLTKIKSKVEQRF